MAGAQPGSPAPAPKGIDLVLQRLNGGPGILYSEKYYDDVGCKFRAWSPLLAYVVRFCPSSSECSLACFPAFLKSPSLFLQIYEYRHVIYPKNMAGKIPRDKIMTEVQRKHDILIVYLLL